MTFGNSLNSGTRNGITMRWAPASILTVQRYRKPPSPETLMALKIWTFSVYYPEQAPNAVPEFHGMSPIFSGGLTNAENYA